MTAALQQYVGNCRVRAVRRYSMVEMTGLFFAFSVIGWLWEVGLHVVLDGELVNRGTMLGPWLPIYGAGGVLAVLLLRRVAYSPALVLALGTGMCTAVEYATGRYLLAVYGLRWWDYSMYPLNVDGLVSPLTSLVFGLGCCAAVYAAGPALADCISRLARRRAASAHTSTTAHSRCSASRWQCCLCWISCGRRCIRTWVQALPHRMAVWS